MKYYGRISSRGQNLRRREFMENEKKKYSIDELFRIISGNPRQFNYRDESANCAYLHS